MCAGGPGSNPGSDKLYSGLNPLREKHWENLNIDALKAYIGYYRPTDGNVFTSSAKH